MKVLCRIFGHKWKFAAAWNGKSLDYAKYCLRCRRMEKVTQKERERLDSLK